MWAPYPVMVTPFFSNVFNQPLTNIFSMVLYIIFYKADSGARYEIEILSLYVVQKWVWEIKLRSVSQHCLRILFSCLRWISVVRAEMWGLKGHHLAKMWGSVDLLICLTLWMFVGLMTKQIAWTCPWVISCDISLTQLTDLHRLTGFQCSSHAIHEPLIWAWASSLPPLPLGSSLIENSRS